MTSFFRKIRNFFVKPRYEGGFTFYVNDVPSGHDRLRMKNFLEFYGFEMSINPTDGYILLRSAEGLELAVTPGDTIAYESYSDGYARFRYDSGKRFLEWDND